MPIQDLCFRSVATVDPRTTVEEAAQHMREEHIGAVVVVDNLCRAVGMVTDRDIVLNVVAAKKSLQTTVDDIMSRNVLAVPVSSGLAEVIHKMAERQVRRALLVDERGVPVGMITTDDLLQLLGNELNSLATLVSRQVSNEGMAKAG